MGGFNSLLVGLLQGFTVAAFFSWGGPGVKSILFYKKQHVHSLCFSLCPSLCFFVFISLSSSSFSFFSFSSCFSSSCSFSLSLFFSFCLCFLSLFFPLSLFVFFLYLVFFLCFFSSSFSFPCYTFHKKTWGAKSNAINMLNRTHYKYYQ